MTSALEIRGRAAPATTGPGTAEAAPTGSAREEVRHQRRDRIRWEQHLRARRRARRAGRSLG